MGSFHSATGPAMPRWYWRFCWLLRRARICTTRWRWRWGLLIRSCWPASGAWINLLVMLDASDGHEPRAKTYSTPGVSAQ
jgi:hypothetical protein